MIEIFLRVNIELHNSGFFFQLQDWQHSMLLAPFFAMASNFVR